MRTTIDLPDDLLRRAKARAALDGVKLKDLVARLLELGLATRPDRAPEKLGHDYPPPVCIPASKLKLKPGLTNDMINDIMDREDAEKAWGIS